MQNRRGRVPSLSMTAAEFQSVLPLVNRAMHEDSIEAARLHLVERMTCAAVGEQFNCSRQKVSANAKAIYKRFEQFKAAQQLVEVRDEATEKKSAKKKPQK